MRYCLVQDESAHWYVIPVNRREDWYRFVESLDKDDCPVPDGWAVPVGGAPSLVTFEQYQIRIL